MYATISPRDDVYATIGPRDDVNATVGPHTFKGNTLPFPQDKITCSEISRPKKNKQQPPHEVDVYATIGPREDVYAIIGPKMNQQQPPHDVDVYATITARDNVYATADPRVVI